MNANKDTAYTITTHRDLAHFVVTQNYDSSKYAHFGKFQYNPIDLSEESNKIQADAARGTSAFPVGFIAENMKREVNILKNNELLFLNKSKKTIYPEEILDAIIMNERIIETENLDAGTVNNEPFEHLKTVMEKKFCDYEVDYNTKNKDEKEFSETIFLIDPLPDMVKSNHFHFTRLDKLIPQILALLQNQSRFKPELIEEAVDMDDFSKFIIAPKRRITKTRSLSGYKALASGFLGAFGGFLKKEYLKHDFYLGRRNCQSFLQHHFVVELEGDVGSYQIKNPIVQAGYSNQAVIERFKYQKKEGGKFYVPIIPDMKYQSHFGSFEDKTPQEKEKLNVEKIIDYNQLPKVDNIELHRIKKQIVTRIRTLICVLISNKKEDSQNNLAKNRDRPLLNIVELIVFGAYLYVFKVHGIARVAIDKVRSELRGHKLFQE